MVEATRDSVLKAYEQTPRHAAPYLERLFYLILVCVVAAFVGAGVYFGTVEPYSHTMDERETRRLRAEFLIEEKTPSPPPKPRKKPVPKEEKPEPIDLSKKPKMNQQVDDIQESKPKRKKVRRVYGVRKVYSKGLGSGGSMSDAVVGKLGNTLDKEVDTITATESDIKGDVVSATTVTSAPSFKRRVRPEYTEEMLANEVEGVVRVKILVDIDGKVKKAKALNDPGFGAAKQALEACLKMEFKPAMRGDQPVAVWIVVPIRFVLLG